MKREGSTRIPLGHEKSSLMMHRGHSPVFRALTWVRWCRIPSPRQRAVMHLALTILLLSPAALFCRPLLLLVFPGILLIHLHWWKQRYLSDLIPVIVGTSLAFWTVSFWFTPYVKLPLSVW